MNPNLPVFRIGQTNYYVQPGDYVWTDIIVGRTTDPNTMPSISYEPISGRVRNDRTVILTNGKIVPLDMCRIAEKVIRL